MRKHFKLVVLFTFIFGMAIPSWGQAPSTEGRDFWVTFLRADSDDPAELKLTISAREACKVTIENTNTNYSQTLDILKDNSCTELIVDKSNCYSSNSNSLTYTALHVYSTKDISLFAGNYRTKSFDAANILPTAALLDDYLIQTYPASDHEDKEQGCHFAIVAVEDGETVVDYNLTATATVPGKSASGSFVTLKKGQVCYIWSGKTKGDVSDLSGSTVKARNNKKIAVFQGCPHTNVPDKVRNRDHIFSQAMPTAYWGTEFAITSSLLRRRDIISVMAINDGTEVYINTEDGEKELVHTFNFAIDKKHYWTFEIGEEIAYCNSSESPYHGKLKELPLVVDSSCYLTTSCPAGVHLIMASNRYDLPTLDTPEPDSDPALLWISPIEQVIKDINFSTYNEGINAHYVNIVTPTANTQSMVWTDEKGTAKNIAEYFHPLRGNGYYSYARLTIKDGSHNLKGELGFLAHAYGYGDKASYAYSCGSSTIQRSISLNDEPFEIDTVVPKKFCVGDEIEIKLNIGNNDYTHVVWDYGDGVTDISKPSASNDDKKSTRHTYNTPGWYDFNVTAEYINPCTGTKYTEDLGLTIHVVRADTVVAGARHICIDVEDYADMSKRDSLDNLLKYGAINSNEDERENCYDTVKLYRDVYGVNTLYEFDTIVRDSIYLFGQWYYEDATDLYDTLPNSNSWHCDSIMHCRTLKVLQCLQISVPGDTATQCEGDTLAISYFKKKGKITGEKARFIVNGFVDTIVAFPNANTLPGTMSTLLLPPTKKLKPGVYRGELRVPDEYCPDKDSLAFPLVFKVYYPKEIFAYKFNNVLAVYKPGNGANTGYYFQEYQWYCNDAPIKGATESVYHSDVPFVIGDRYFVMLKDRNGLVLPSCELAIPYSTDYTKQPTNAPAKKMIRNQRFYILKEGMVFDMYGQRVE